MGFNFAVAFSHSLRNSDMSEEKIYADKMVGWYACQMGSTYLDAEMTPGGLTECIKWVKLGRSRLPKQDKDCPKAIRDILLALDRTEWVAVLMQEDEHLSVNEIQQCRSMEVTEKLLKQAQELSSDIRYSMAREADRLLFPQVASELYRRCLTSEFNQIALTIIKRLILIETTEVCAPIFHKYVHEICSCELNINGFDPLNGLFELIDLFTFQAILLDRFYDTRQRAIDWWQMLIPLFRLVQCVDGPQLQRHDRFLEGWRSKYDFPSTFGPDHIKSKSSGPENILFMRAPRPQHPPIEGPGPSWDTLEFPVCNDKDPLCDFDSDDVNGHLSDLSVPSFISTDAFGDSSPSSRPVQVKVSVS